MSKTSPQDVIDKIVESGRYGVIRFTGTVDESVDEAIDRWKAWARENGCEHLFYEREGITYFNVRKYVWEKRKRCLS